MVGIWESDIYGPSHSNKLLGVGSSGGGGVLLWEETGDVGVVG